MKTYRYFLFFLICTAISCSKDDLSSGVETSSTAHLYATGGSGLVKRYDINTGEVTTYNTGAVNASGIKFSAEGDGFSLVSAGNSRLEFFSDISMIQSGVTTDIEADYGGTDDLENPKDLAINGNFYVVSDNTDLDGDETTAEGRLFIYFKNSGNYILRNVVTTRFKVWGIEFVGNDLYAAVDETNRLAVYRNFLSTHTLNRIITADKHVGFQGLLQMHGLDFEDGTMVLSDIGEMESNSDGAIHIVEDFVSKFETAAPGGFVQADQQKRIAGGNTLLGNPGDLVYDSAYNVVFVAETTNGSGRILAFNDARDKEGNLAPDLRYDFSGVTSLFYHTQ
ncbi:hypothetical protein MKO06_06740 [Gramella sp. GC03-9]|uniref:Uncharacterized protein n=1 Tax=Christiangramia oceanisediminis TaxID=2920386 RepID=A0A9X2I8U8_9FLAO|nr:hypothetical protein [Gramella oceanisediminis]MCP9199596.1 hypothetical protein [Gramella oceanisediminis]